MWADFTSDGRPIFIFFSFILFMLCTHRAGRAFCSLGHAGPGRYLYAPYSAGPGRADFCRAEPGIFGPCRALLTIVYEIVVPSLTFTASKIKTLQIAYIIRPHSMNSTDAACCYRCRT